MDQTQSLVQLTPEIEAFLDSCLWDKGIKDVPKEMHDQMVQNLAARLESWMLNTALMSLSDDDNRAFEQLLETNPSQEQITQFLSDHIPGLPKIFEQAMFEFKQAYVKG